MPKESWCWSSNTCIWGYVIMAKKCPNCNSKRTEVLWATSEPDLVWRVQSKDDHYYCYNCGNAFK